ncbi:hypothetical protein APB27_08515 [Pseudomonas aeruginosa]|nr:hypothetical protein AN454_06160 [Pseudomonas aeruginosa]KSP92517.1 hypothetical protein APB27_08515 [Pseudomonas aeruginosa]
MTPVLPRLKEWATALGQQPSSSGMARICQRSSGDIRECSSNVRLILEVTIPRHTARSLAVVRMVAEGGGLTRDISDSGGHATYAYMAWMLLVPLGRRDLPL